VPMRAAALCALWLQKEFGLGVTLKWPNDLLFGGRKLGGLLCESFQDHHQDWVVLVGVGLNIWNEVGQRDVVGDDFALQPCSLGELGVVPKAFSDADLKAKVDAFIAFFAEQWSASTARLCEVLQRVSLVNGSPWVKRSDPRRVFFQDVTWPGGELKLRAGT